MANAAEVDKSIYYVPDSGWYPVFLAFGLMLTVTGLLQRHEGGCPSSSYAPAALRVTLRSNDASCPDHL